MIEGDGSQSSTILQIAEAELLRAMFDVGYYPPNTLPPVN
jgi:hypothetical protein